MNFSNIWQHPKTSVMGLLIAITTIAGVLSQQGITLGNAGKGTVIALIAGIASAFLGLLAQDGPKDPGSSQSSASKLGMVLIAFLLLGAVAQAQTLDTQATASAVHYNGQWLMGTTQTQSFPLVYWGQQKGNVFSIGARELIVPGTFSIWGAVANVKPDISALIAKTTFNPDQFSLSFDVAGGMATFTDNTTQPAIEGRVNFSYSFTPNVAMTGAYAGGGLIGKQTFGDVSAGLQYRFGAGNVPSLAAKRLAARVGRKLVGSRRYSTDCDSGCNALASAF